MYMYVDTALEILGLEETVTETDGQESLRNVLIKKRSALQLLSFDEKVISGSDSGPFSEWRDGTQTQRSLVARATWCVLVPHVQNADDAEKGLVGYFPTTEDLLKNRPHKIKLGRLLKKTFPFLDDKTIKTETELLKNFHGPATLRWAETEDEWVWVYENSVGFSSCMELKNPRQYLDRRINENNHPVRLYARSGQLVLAYLENKTGTVTARAICRKDQDGNVLGYVSLYGNCARLLQELRKLGYAKTVSLDGVRLPLVWLDSTKTEFICPYVDNPKTVIIDEDTKEIVISSRRGVLDVCSSGVIEVFSCPVCGGFRYEDEEFCENCAHDYVMAYAHNGEREPAYIGDVVEFGGDYYIIDALEEYSLFICSECGYVCSISEETNDNETGNSYCDYCTRLLGINQEEEEEEEE